ncbi:hypothetical protein QJS10_CPB13g00979 [Acorus calamus]|uniref:Uncharacterized protein n=1 Tax=Acorus calamus TaxID=4465 RepID=A0AAV9DIK3_ACOCL|nr:hypothetical protein QJS10_CPB13g00979 [Acorus calamus]
MDHSHYDGNSSDATTNRRLKEEVKRPRNEGKERKVALKLIPEREEFISLLMTKGQDYNMLKKDIQCLVSLLLPFLNDVHSILVYKRGVVRFPESGYCSGIVWLHCGASSELPRAYTRNFGIEELSPSRVLKTVSPLPSGRWLARTTNTSM